MVKIINEIRQLVAVLILAVAAVAFFIPSAIAVLAFVIASANHVSSISTRRPARRIRSRW